MKVKDAVRSRAVALGVEGHLGVADDVMSMGRIRHLPVIDGHWRMQPGERGGRLVARGGAHMVLPGPEFGLLPGGTVRNQPPHALHQALLVFGQRQRVIDVTGH